MFNYMTDIETVEIDGAATRSITAEGHDLHSLIFSFLDEWLFVFSTEGLVVKEAHVIELVCGGDDGVFRCRCVGHGEQFDLAKHPQGTEIKAITYSNMQVHETKERTDLYVIVDI
jgi:SHS2 domain-containing protein